MLNAGCRTVLAVLALALGLAGAALAQDVIPVNVRGRVTLTVPADWSISDAAGRRAIRDMAKDMGFADSHTAGFAAQSHPVPSRAMVRVSILPLDPPLSQAEVRQEVATDRRGAIRSLEEMWAQEAPAMWAALGKHGVREVGKPRLGIEVLGGHTALVIEYGRTATTPGDTMLVTQYHVVMGSEKALITLSRIVGDAKATAMHDRIKASIRFN